MKNINELCHQTLLDTAEVLDDALGVTEVARGNEDPIGSTSWTSTSERDMWKYCSRISFGIVSMAAGIVRYPRILLGTTLMDTNLCEGIPKPKKGF